MSTKTNAIKKLDIKDVYLDFPSTLIKIGRETGQKKWLGSVSKECDVSAVIVNKWGKKAPNVVAIIYAYLKEYNLTFEELVQEVKVNKTKTRIKVDKNGTEN